MGSVMSCNEHICQRCVTFTFDIDLTVCMKPSIKQLFAVPLPTYPKPFGTSEKYFVCPIFIKITISHYAAMKVNIYILRTNLPTQPKHTAGRGSSIGSVSAWNASSPEFDPHVRQILLWRLVMKEFYCHSPSSADSRRAVVSYWRKNVH